MRTVNKVTLIGNVTRDPAVKTTESGQKMAFFTIATNRYYKTADWENKSESEFHNCVVWGKKPSLTSRQASLEFLQKNNNNQNAIAIFILKFTVAETHSKFQSQMHLLLNNKKTKPPQIPWRHAL